MPLIAIIYAAFISLGLPDGVLGAAWPQMAPSLHAPLAGAGALALITSANTIVASFSSGWILKRLSTVGVSISSVALTVTGLLGCALAPNFWALALWCIPLGLGAGAIDSALNAYVSLHFSALHMNFLHACWGLGAMTGPLIAGFFLNFTGQWRPTYATIAAAQTCLMLLLIVTRGSWPRKSQLPESDIPPAEVPTHEQPIDLGAGHDTPHASTLAGNLAADPSSTRSTPNPSGAQPTSAPAHTSAQPAPAASSTPWYQIPLVWPTLIGFFCYCCAEGTIGLWASTFLAQYHHLTLALAAAAGSAFYIGITVGRFLAGLASLKFTNPQLLRLGATGLMAGILLALLAPIPLLAVAGFALCGLGCAPIYPAVIKETGRRLGVANVQRATGLQMGFAYVGFMLAPPATGVALTAISPLALPTVVCALAAVMVGCHEYIERQLR
ncbi:MAG: MFS transporter [Arcanobacterium sp.]|nr:MFS transporter [Arcanobacterium sp.]